MFTGQLSEQSYNQIQNDFLAYKSQHPNAGPTELMIGLHRLYERELYGVTANDLERGYQIRYSRNPDNPTQIIKEKCAVRGVYLSNLQGGKNPNAFPTAVYQRDKWVQDGGTLKTEQEFYHDLDQQREISLAVEETGVSSGSGTALLESGIDTGYGATSGIITPVFMNMFMKLAAEKTMFKNFANLVPMPDMTFYFPMRNSIVSDNSTEVSATAAVTLEGRAGLDIGIKYTKWEVNGWKFLRHFELTEEVQLMLGKFINVQSDMVEDLAQAHALLWDYSIAYGMVSMLRTGMWRRYDSTATAGMKDSDTEIPFGKASVLTTNAKDSYLFQSKGSGQIYEPAVATGDEFKWDSSTLLASSGSTDELLEGILELATLQKRKKSKLEFIAIPEAYTSSLFRDSRVSNNTINTGTTAFSSEDGYLGKIALIGTNETVDVWEYNGDVCPTFEDDDATPNTCAAIFGGRYGKSWALGVYTPYYLRVDEGYEIDARGVGSANVMRSNETTVLTSGSRGSSWPLDYHDLSILWQVDEAHV